MSTITITITIGPLLVLATLALLKAGAAQVPINPWEPTARIQHMLENSAAGAVLVTRAQAPILAFKLTHPRVLVLEDVLGWREDEGWEDNCEGLGELRENEGRDIEDTGLDVELQDGEGGARDRTETNSEVGGSCFRKVASVQREEDRHDGLMNPEAPSHVIYTSGTTGHPKGVVCSHRGLLHYCRAKVKAHSITSASRVLLVSAHTWDPCIGELISTLLEGATLCVGPRGLIVQDLALALQRSRASHVLATPGLWSMLGEGPGAFPDLKVAALGGEKIPPGILEEWGGAVCLLNTYGTTEATVYQTTARLDPGSDPARIGTPLDGVLLALDEGGQLWIGGLQLASGYLNSPELTADFFRPGSVMPASFPVCPYWVRSGDRGKYEADGGIVLLGRTDSQVKINGMRVELGEVRPDTITLSTIHA